MATKLKIQGLKDSIKASCDQSAQICADCDCWLDLLDGEPIDGCFHNIQHEDTTGKIACVECGMILEPSALLNQLLSPKGNENGYHRN